jgi:hypothetical protein
MAKYLKVVIGLTGFMNAVECSPKTPIVLSILGFIVWLVFILIFTLYWSPDYTLFQNIMITSISFLIVGALIGIMWVIYPFRE